MDSTDRYHVKFIKFSNGERFPLLINGKGLPEWHITLFSTTQIRNASKAPNTMAAALSAIKMLLEWTRVQQINLESRFQKQYFLTEAELESLRSHTQKKTKEDDLIKNKVIQLSSFERARGAIQKNVKRVTSSTQYIRMSYIADYLKWLAVRTVEQSNRQMDEVTFEQIMRMVKSFVARRPRKSIQSRESARKGLTEEQQFLLLNVIKPTSEKNPFSLELRGRNQLIVLLLFHLGLRAGELLGLKVSDFDLQKNTLLVARRHDNAQDPRDYQPVVKTVDRRIPLSEELIKMVSDYVLYQRRRFIAAKKHDFLLVTHQPGPFEGQPLSIKGLSKVFSEIQRVVVSDISGLTPHILRHTANDRFSQLMNCKGIGQSEEEKMRSYLMGWKEGSGTAATYTRRHIEKKAHEAALILQEQ